MVRFLARCLTRFGARLTRAPGSQIQSHSFTETNPTMMDEKYSLQFYGDEKYDFTVLLYHLYVFICFFPTVFVPTTPPNKNLDLLISVGQVFGRFLVSFGKVLGRYGGSFGRFGGDVAWYLGRFRGSDLEAFERQNLQKHSKKVFKHIKTYKKQVFVKWSCRRILFLAIVLFS